MHTLMAEWGLVHGPLHPPIHPSIRSLDKVHVSLSLGLSGPSHKPLQPGRLMADLNVHLVSTNSLASLTDKWQEILICCIWHSIGSFPLHRFCFPEIKDGLIMKKFRCSCSLDIQKQVQRTKVWLFVLPATNKTYKYVCYVMLCF